MWTTSDQVPASGLVLQELQDGVERQVAEGPVSDRQEGFSATQGGDGHQDQVAELREQRQALGKVKAAREEDMAEKVHPHPKIPSYKVTVRKLNLLFTLTGSE